ncbi:MAG: glycosyltransferase 87 family protein [Propionibacteriaceae bacterium]|nr:glycosyltransferase 87 family protein [Propionibacteriaceae bacterium]
MTVTGRANLTNRDVLIPVGLVALFLATRILIFRSLQLKAVSFVANDVGYYGFYLNKLSLGETDVMLEYPVPAVWALQAIYWLGGGVETWSPVYVAVFLALDAVIALLMYRRGNAAGSLFWILFTGAQGAIVLHRFDLIPAALVAVACLYALRFPKVAGAAIGLGAAIKLWPALLIGALLAPFDRGRARLLGFIAAGFGLAAASLITSGWTRSASPLTWQSDRGLQIESVPATPLMALRAFTFSERWTIELTPFNAVEVTVGPGVGLMMGVSTVLTAGAVVLTVYLGYRLLRAFRVEDHRSHEAMVLAVLAIVLATVVANKTLSPQYIVWLGGPVAALLVIRRSEWLRSHTVVLAVSMLVVGGLTQLVYPWMVYGLMAVPLGSGPETAVLVLRNLALITLTFYAVWLAIRATRRTTI